MACVFFWVGVKGLSYHHLPHFLPKAAGVSEYYEIMYKYWEAPLKALQDQHREKAKAKGIKEVEVIPDDDDGDLETLESISLQQARRGIVIEGVIVIEDGGDVGAKLGGNPKNNNEEMKSGASGESVVEKPRPLGGVEVSETPPAARTRSPKIPLNIDDVNPPGLPHLGPYDLPGKPNALRAPSQAGACEARIQALQ